MASYQLIKENGHIRGNDCALHIDEGNDGDIESAFEKINPPSPRMSPRLRKGFAPGANDSAILKCSPPSPPARLLSLDVFRGLTVALMILVDDAGGILPMINHSPWNGLTLADLVMPFFLFMVGVSLALVYKKLSCRALASRKAVWRTSKLFVLGIFLQGGYFHGINDLSYGVDIQMIRWMGILQRIAAVYWVAAMCEIWFRNDEKVTCGFSAIKKYRRHWVVMFIITTTYLVLLYGLYVPDWEYQIPYEASPNAVTFKVKCGARGGTGPACNAAGMIDRTILGVQHLYRKPIYARTKQCSINSPDYGVLPPDAPSWCQAPFDPEGILSTLMAIVACLIGLQYGHIIVHFKDHKSRLSLWLLPSSCLILIGSLCDIFGMHINKALYSFSYTCVTTGVAGVVFAMIYLVVDVYGWSGRVVVLLKWMGMNALLIYVFVACNILPLILQGFYWRHPNNNILTLIGIRKHSH